jgi:hypothetical protein
MSENERTKDRVLTPMARYCYCCPAAGVNVQGFTASDLASENTGYEIVACLACTSTHMVNPRTGKVLDERE